MWTNGSKILATVVGAQPRARLLHIRRSQPPARPREARTLTVDETSFPNAKSRNALLIECGQHWEAGAPHVAKQMTLRFLRHFGMCDPGFLGAHLEASPIPRQKIIEVTDVVTIATNDFSFVAPVEGLSVVAKAGSLLARDGGGEVTTPYDDCVLIMPTRRPKKGETAVRLGRFVN